MKTAHKKAIDFKGPDRRHRTRYRARLSVIVRNNGTEITGTTRNVSLLGVSALTNGPVLRGQPVQCKLELPGAEAFPLSVNGTVIRCEPAPAGETEGSHTVGVFFQEFEGRGESTLSKFLREVVQQERQIIKTGYKELKKRLEDRTRRKQLEELEKKRRRLARLRRRKLRLARQEKRASLRRRNKKSGQTLHTRSSRRT